MLRNWLPHTLTRYLSHFSVIVHIRIAVPIVYSFDCFRPLSYESRVFLSHPGYSQVTYLRSGQVVPCSALVGLLTISIDWLTSLVLRIPILVDFA